MWQFPFTTSLIARLCLVIVAVCWSNLAVADQAACRQAPTRDCVLELGIDRALSQTNPYYLASNLLQVAVFEEEFAPDQSRKTLELLFRHLDQRVPDDVRRAQILGTQGIAYWRFWSQREEQLPAESLVLRAVLAEIESISESVAKEDREKVQAYTFQYHMMLDDRAALVALIGKGDPAVTQAKVTGALADLAMISHDTQRLDQFATTLRDTIARDTLFNEAALYFAGRNSVWLAVGYTDAIVHDDLRRATRVSLVETFSQAGLVDDARSLMAHPDFPKGRPQQAYALSLAEIYAHLGDQRKLDYVLRVLFEFGYRSERHEVAFNELRSTAALLNDDYSLVVANAFRTQEPDQTRVSLQFSDGIYRQAGRARLENLFAHLTGDQRLYALQGYASYLARTDDIEGAMRVHEQLTSLGGGMGEVGYLRLSMVLALAKDGQPAQSLAMAEGFERLFWYDDIARAIHVSTTP